MRLLVLSLLLAAMEAAASTRILVTVVEQKTAKPVTDLKADDFSVIDGGAPRRVEGVEFQSAPIDVMLLVDSSLVGQAVQKTASDLINQMEGKEQMAMVAYHSSADLLQDFTSSRQSLQKALLGIKYGNDPRALDGIYAAADGGFEHATFRKVILLLTTGFEGSSRTSEKNVVRLCRKNGISIYPLYLGGRERGLFEMLARNTGGVAMNMRDVEKSGGAPGKRIFEVMRGTYAVTLGGNLSVSEKLEITLKRQGKFFISSLPLD